MCADNKADQYFREGLPAVPAGDYDRAKYLCNKVGLPGKRILYYFYHAEKQPY